jgi:hypothetical protein
VSRRSKGRINGPFVPMMKATNKTLAWKALSHGARSLYMALRSRYNSTLQNAVYISTREASAELGSHSRRPNVMRWFRELEYYGFTRMVSPAHHGVNGHGKAPHWRLTEEGYLGKEPTRDFLHWDGVIFHEQKSPKHYQTKNRSRGTYDGTTLVHAVVPVSDQAASINGTSGTAGVSICEPTSGTPAESITSLTTPCSDSGLTGWSPASLPLPAAVIAALPADTAAMIVLSAFYSGNVIGLEKAA